MTTAHRTAHRDVRSTGARAVGARDRPPRASAALALLARHLSARVRGRHRRADAALRPAACHRAGQVRARLPVHAPAGRRRETRFHAQGTATSVADEADRPLHPELRRRAKTAEQAFAERRWRHEVDQWFDRDRSVQLAENLALQAVEPGALDDVELAAHVTSARSHFERSARRNLATHGGDLVPTGDLLAHCERWGDRRQRGGRSAHRQLAGDGRDSRHARPGGERDPAQRGAGGLARDGRRRASTRPRRPSRRRRLASAAHVAHGHQRRRRPGHPGRGPRPATGGAARRHRESRRRRTRRRSRSCPRPG